MAKADNVDSGADRRRISLYVPAELYKRYMEEVTRRKIEDEDNSTLNDLIQEAMRDYEF